MVSCDDGSVYVVKGQYAGRQAVNDQIVAHLGAALAASTGRPALVEVTAPLIAAEPQLQDLFGAGPFQPGIWHGSLHVGNVSEDRENIAHQQVPENRGRYSVLALLYGWAWSSDHQFLFEKTEPRLVFSVDHGHFFPGGPQWTIASVQQHAAQSVPDPTIVASCALSSSELRAASANLATIDPVACVARAVAAPLDGWGITLDERVALAHYLARRHTEMLGSIAALPP